jgi:hypothetical protein
LGFCWSRNIANSAGLMDATPTWQMGRPISMSFCVVADGDTAILGASRGEG